MLYFVIKCALSGIIIAAVRGCEAQPGIRCVNRLTSFGVATRDYLLRAGVGFWPGLGACCALTVALISSRLGRWPGSMASITKTGHGWQVSNSL